MLASQKSPESGLTALATNPAALVGVVMAVVLLVLAARLLRGHRARVAAATYARQLTEAANTGSVVGATVVPTGRPRPKVAAAPDGSAVDLLSVDEPVSDEPVSDEPVSDEPASDEVEPDLEPATVEAAAVELTAEEVEASDAAHIERRRLPRRRALREERKGRRGSRGRRVDDIDQTLLADPARVAIPVVPLQPAPPVEPVPAPADSSAEEPAAGVQVTQVTAVDGSSPTLVMVDVLPLGGDSRVPQPRPEPAAPVLRPEDLLDPIDEFTPSDELPLPHDHLTDPPLPGMPSADLLPADLSPAAPVDSAGPEPVDPFVPAPIFGAAPPARTSPHDPAGVDPADSFDPTAPTGLPATFHPTAPTGLPELFDPGPAEVAYPAPHLDQGYLAEPHGSDDIGGWAADRSDEEIWQMTAPSHEAGAGAGVVTDAQTEVSATMPQVAVSLPQVTGSVEHSGMVQPHTPDNEAPSDGTSWAAAPAQTWTTPSSQDAVGAESAPVAPAPAPIPTPVYVPAPVATAPSAARGNWWDNDGQPSTPAAATATASAVETAIAISQAYAPRPERQASAAAKGSSFGKVVLDFEPRTPNEDGEEVVNRIVSQILASVGVDPAAVARHQTIDEMPDWAFDAPRVPSQRGVTPSSRQRDGLRRAAKRLTTAATRASAAQTTAEEAALLVDGDVAAVVVHSVEGPRVLWLHPEGGESQIWGPQTLSALLAAGAPVREVLEADPLADGATTALLAVPIASAGTLAGTLVVRRLRAEGFTIAEQGVLDRLARMTGASLDAIARRGALAGDEDLDPVTGLVRRERMLVDLRTAVRTRAEHDLPVSLVLAEVDGLARMRTEYGDADADEALRLIATTLNSQLRVGDIAYRHGEDDVAVLLPATELDDAEIVAGRLAGAAEQILAERFQLPRPLRLRTAAVPVEEDAAKTIEQAIIMLGAERNHERQVIEAAQRRRLAAELEQR